MDSSSQVRLAALASSRSSGYEEDAARNSLHSRHSHELEDELEQIALAPVDGGRRAWMFLVGCFFTEALVWGKALQLANVLICVVYFVGYQVDQKFNSRLSLLIWYLSRILRNS